MSKLNNCVTCVKYSPTGMKGFWVEKAIVLEQLTEKIQYMRTRTLIQWYIYSCIGFIYCVSRFGNVLILHTTAFILAVYFWFWLKLFMYELYSLFVDFDCMHNTLIFSTHCSVNNTASFNGHGERLWWCWWKPVLKIHKHCSSTIYCMLFSGWVSVYIYMWVSVCACVCVSVCVCVCVYKRLCRHTHTQFSQYL